jgi:hypothetical protein
MGQSYDINLGPLRIPIDLHDKTLIQAAARQIGITLEVVVFLFLLAYSCAEDDDQRAVLLVALQLILQALLVALMSTQALYQQADQQANGVLKGSYLVPADQATSAGLKALENPVESSIAEISTVISLFALPPLAASLGESKLVEKEGQQ